jgi:TonB-dependent receptor-like protein
VSQFLDTGSIGTGGVTIVVNGMEVNSLNVSASAIQQIKINSDPYSAEYSRPGRGRIEILTKPGGQSYHGELNGTLRDGALNARNAFATTRPSEGRRILEGSFGGPLGRGGKSSFMVSGQADTDDQQLFIVARGLSGEVRDSAPVANRHRLISGSLTFQPSDKTTISIRPSYEYTSNPTRGVGGTTLASAAWTYEHTEDDLTYMQQTIINPALVNQFQIQFGYENEPTLSASPNQAIVVDGAFRSGGAQNTLLRTERHVQASESLTWTKRHHLVQFGFQVPDWSWRGFNDQTNAGGTFYFAGLQAVTGFGTTITGGTPYAFVQQVGNGRVNWLEKVLGAYVRDDWQLRPGVTLSLGVRYDWANYFTDNNNIAPRLSAAYAISKSDIIRGGGGVFYDKIGPFPVLDVLHSQPGGLQRYVVTNPSYPNPLLNGQPVPSITQFAPSIEIPYTFQYSLGLEHQLVKGTTLAVTYTGSRGSLFRSRDINAPLAPPYTVRPNPAYGQIRQIESTGRQNSDSVTVALRGKITKWFNGQTFYTLGRTYTDSGGVTSFAANDYDLTGEWARADFDRRHQFVMIGRVPTPLLDFGVNLALRSGTPYTELLSGDPFGNGRGNARPVGVPRNGLEGAGLATLDVRASRDLAFRKGTPQARTMTIALDTFNILNRVNYANYVGTLSSPLFGQPVSARAPRQLQLSARVKF